MAERFTVLGAGGFIGGQLVAHLRRKGHECHAPARNAAPDPRTEHGHMVYCIGLTSDFRGRPLETVEAHVCVLRDLLQQARFSSLTYLSSTRVYAGAQETVETAALRVAPGAPDDLYNLSKLMGESLCLHGGRAGVKVARLSNVVGLRPDADIFIDQLLHEGFTRGEILFRSGPASAKDYVHVDDVVTALETMALSPATGLFNVASGRPTSNAQIAAAIEAQLGIPCRFEPGAPEWAFPPIDIGRARALLGFAPQPFEQFFPHHLAAYRAARNGKP